jgi:hypothetical protein
MTRNDIIRMAREAGTWSQQFKNRDVEYVMSAESLERFATLAAAAEREAIAKYFAEHWRETWTDEQIAEAIRARGQDPMPLFDDWNKDWTK